MRMKRMAAGLTLALFWVSAVFANHASASGEPRSLTQAIGQAGLFSDLTGEEKAALETAALLRHGRKGERVIEQGRSQKRMLVILQGESEVRVHGKTVAILPAQSLVGEIEFLDGFPASADVVLLQDSQIIELDNAKLESLMNQQPRIGYILMREIARIEARRLRAMNEK
jgi:CRP-like cAMP-binding protein